MRRAVADMAVGKRPPALWMSSGCVLLWASVASTTRGRANRPPWSRDCLVWTRRAVRSCSSRRRLRRQGRAAFDRAAGRGDERVGVGGAVLLEGPCLCFGIDPALFEKNDIHVHVPAAHNPRKPVSA